MNCNVSYFTHDSYLDKFRQDKKESLQLVPFTNLRTFSKNGHEGLYGWTYRNKDGAVRVREDLVGMKKLEVDIHESIHTPDEYETRKLTEWIMSSFVEDENKYQKKVRYVV